MIRLVVLAIVLVGILGAGLMLVSIQLDEPSRDYRHAVVVKAPRKAIWALLTELDRYAVWNPYITTASGRAIEGSSVELTFKTDDGSGERATAEVLVVHPMRKFEWRTRTLVPGLLDHEQIFRVIPHGRGRYLVQQDARLEGLLAPFSDFEDHREGLRAMLAVIAERAPGYQSLSP